MLNRAYGKGINDLAVTIVDDNKNTLEIFKIIFLELKVKKINCFEDAEEAFNFVKSHTCDIVVLDWFMEPTGGKKFLMRLRHNSMETLALTPVIVVTSSPSESILKDILITGADEILAKPISPLQMLKRLKAVTRCQTPYRDENGFFIPGTYPEHRIFKKNVKTSLILDEENDNLYI